MATFDLELPNDIIKDCEKLFNNSEKIFGEMTRAGAKAVESEIRGRLPLPEMASGLKITRTYKTPSDGGINTKVYLTGYIPFKGNRKAFVRRGGNGQVYSTNKGVPIPFLATLYEYGRSNVSFPKKPFLRKAFNNKTVIEKAMLEAQKKASGGIIDE